MDLAAKLAAAKEEQVKANPPCNAKWTQDEGTKLWCEDSMVKQPLASPLVPRKVDDGTGNTRCLCVEWTKAKGDPEKYQAYGDCRDAESPSQTCHIPPNHVG